MFCVGVAFFWLGMHLGFDVAWNNVLELTAMQVHSMAQIAIGHRSQHWWRCCCACLETEAGLYTTSALQQGSCKG